VLLQYQSQRRLVKVSTAVRQSLRLRAIAVMESIEFQQLLLQQQKQQRNNDGTAQAYANQSALLEVRAQAEEARAQQLQHRAHQYETMWENEKRDAEYVLEQVQRDNDLRLALLANITKEQDMEDKLEQEELAKRVHLGWCDTALVRSACMAIGGVTSLHNQELDEKARIVQDTQELNGIEENEFLDELIALFLLGKAQRYNETAQDLIKLAAIWKARAQHDEAQAVLYNRTAEQLLSEQEQLKKRTNQEHNWELLNEKAASKLWTYAKRQQSIAYWLALPAIFLALVALCFYLLPLLFVKFCSFAVAFVPTVTSSIDAQKNVSYAVQHALIVLLTLGICKSFLLHLDAFGIPQRAVIVIWFAFLAGLIDTVLLHTIPLCMWFQSVRSMEEVKEVAIQTALRLGCNSVFSVTEFLVLWLTARDLLFSVDALDFLGRPLVRLVILCSVALHVVVYRPRPSAIALDTDDDKSTMPTMDESFGDADDLTDSSSGSKSSPMTTSKFPPRSFDAMTVSSATENRPLVYLDEMRGHQHTTSRSAAGASFPYIRVNLRAEWRRLAVSTNLVLVVCAVSVIVHGIPVTWIHPTRSMALLLVVVAASISFVWRSHYGISQSYEWIHISTSVPQKFGRYEARQYISV
jgi:hypothetical protein